MSRTLLLMSCLVIGLLILACGGPPTNKNGAANESAKTAATPAPTAAATAAASEQVGIPECDNFITAYENCVTTKVPDAAREQYRAAVARWRTEWKKLAENPQTKAGLAQACKLQIETARTQMKAYNCTF